MSVSFIDEKIEQFAYDLEKNDPDRQKKLQESGLIAATISLLSGTIHELNKNWWKDLETGEPKELNIDFTLSRLMLIVTEVAEAAEGGRKNMMDDHLPNRPMLEVELADAVIRILDMAEGYGLDIGGAIAEKLEYNSQRADHKIENRKKEGGKQA